jgi:P27 family predicted phage terminase small subunit
MSVGRKPKPSALHELEGTRNRRKNSEPKFSGIPTCPKHLDKNARVEWKRVSSELAAAGLLTIVDRAALAAYCAAWSRWANAEEQVQKFGAVIKSPKSGFPIQNPYVGIANTALDQLRRFAAEFGMTPSSRSRIHVADGPTSTDPFTEFMQSIGAGEEMTTDEHDQEELQRAST